MNLKVSHKNGGRQETVFGVISYTKDFRRGTLQVNAQSENGQTYGEYSLADIDNVEEDFEDEPGVPDAQRGLTTYQHRAIRNLPPKIAGAPDQTFDALLPKIASPTPTVLPEEEIAETGLRNAEQASSNA